MLPAPGRYEKALELTWGPTRGKTGGTSRAERDIAAVALGLRAPGTHLPGIDHLALPDALSAPRSEPETFPDDTYDSGT